MPIEIARDATGSMKRVSWEHPVLTSDPLVRLQRLVANGTPAFRPSALDDLHLTLFHYGKPQNLHQEIVKNGQGISLDELITRFEAVLGRDSSTRSGYMRVFAGGLDNFGDENKPVVVVRLTPPKDLLKLRRNLLVSFYEFLDQCGVKDVEKFMLGSENLRYQTEANYNPHLTLGSLQPTQQAPNIDCGGISVLIGPPILANVISKP